mmetsp:Transcript_24341/g.84591  ORF Transcript_24341/g.84591 Transcript_24341/m.84591 type:complete len:214 (+) Transcript_24341:1969-2610(+)
MRPCARSISVAMCGSMSCDSSFATWMSAEPARLRAVISSAVRRRPLEPSAGAASPSGVSMAAASSGRRNAIVANSRCSTAISASPSRCSTLQKRDMHSTSLDRSSGSAHSNASRSVRALLSGPQTSASSSMSTVRTPFSTAVADSASPPISAVAVDPPVAKPAAFSASVAVPYAASVSRTSYARNSLATAGKHVASRCSSAVALPRSTAWNSA